MTTLVDAQDAYDRHNIHVGVIHSDVADVILTLEAERDRLRAALAAPHPGAALLAELAAARAVVEAVRARWLDEPVLNALVEAYDAAVLKR